MAIIIIGCQIKNLLASNVFVYINSYSINVPASDVSLIIEIYSLPREGKIALIACGNIIFTMQFFLLIPRDLAASVWPISTDSIPPRNISDTYALELRTKETTTHKS